MPSPVRLIEPRRFVDDRGWFSEIYSLQAFAARGIDTIFVQDNHSLSKPIGTIRGLHFQIPPHGQAKLVRCIRGAILDVAVDVRQGSPTFGKWVAAELTAENGHQLYIPVGFAHGFATLAANCEITYKVSDVYAPQCDGGIAWNDPRLAIDWRLPLGTEPTFSEKDSKLPLLRDFVSPFDYDGYPLEELKT